MDFAKKQLEKYGWKEGEGVGKEGNKGLVTALKPKCKNGKEGMGYNMAKDLVDPWWSKAYNDSLKRINVNHSDSEDIAISFGFDGEELETEDRPLEKIRKRGLKANYIEFAKGATLNNGKLKYEDSSSSDKDLDLNSDSSASKSAESGGKEKEKGMGLTDEELFKACGGRTTHKSARFGHHLSGKLSRIAAQEKELVSKLEQNSSSEILTSKKGRKRKFKS